MEVEQNSKEDDEKERYRRDLKHYSRHVTLYLSHPPDNACYVCMYVLVLHTLPDCYPTCVLPPNDSWRRVREKLPEVGMAPNNDPRKFMKPRARNSYKA